MPAELSIERAPPDAQTPCSLTDVVPTDAQGAFTLPIPVPNLPSLRYENVWFTGLFGGAQPARRSQDPGIETNA